MSSAPATPSLDQSFHHAVTMDDLAFLDQLTSSSPRGVPKFQRREAIFDPLIFAAAVSSGPHVTRHHFHHDFFPTDDYNPNDRHAEVGSYDTCDWSGDDIAAVAPSAEAPRYVSHQKPRRERLQEAALSSIERTRADIARSGQSTPDDELPTFKLPITKSPKKRRPSLLPSHDPEPLQNILKSLEHANTLCPAPKPTASPRPRNEFSPAHPPQPKASSRPALTVQCRARTRVPTPHGSVFLHLYHNNWDAKEHLAVVADSAQLEAGPLNELVAPPIRSRSLDAQWHEGETDMERIIRGAYIGRLSPNSSVVSVPHASSSTTTGPTSEYVIPAPLVRIHSECFTGETIGSMRCDCGEQLDEAIRLISLPQTVCSSKPNSPSTTIPGRGAVVYLRQEGRGIGLLEKIRAYNLQDLGHDTVSANLLLGHGADERGYEIAAAIMRDLGLGAGGEGDEAERKGVRLLTNNPEKMEALEREGIRIEERVAMVPRSWKCGNDHGPKRRMKTKRRSGGKRSMEKGRAEDDADADADSDSDSSHASFEDLQLRRGGATLIGAGAAHGPELERYLRTKVQRMRHMIDLPPSQSQSHSASSSNSPSHFTPSPPTAVSTPAADIPRHRHHGAHASELAYKMGLVSQNVSEVEQDDEDEDEDEDEDDHVHARMSQSLRSLIASTPDLESDRGSVGRLSMMGSRAASPTHVA